MEAWLRAEAHGDDHHHHHHAHDVNRHDDHIQAFCITEERPISWTGFATWLEMLTATQGERLLRLKGILNIAGEDTPVAVHGVQHVFHPPQPLPGWPDGDHHTRIVLVTRDIDPRALEETFRAFVAASF